MRALARSRWGAASGGRELAGALAALGTGLFLLLFLTLLDRALVREGWLPVPGVVLFLAVAAALLAASAAQGEASLRSHCRRVLRSHRPFWIAFALLALLGVVGAFRWQAARFADMTYLAVAMAVCAIMASLAPLPAVHRWWRTCLAAALISYCATVWLDAWLLGLFADHEWRPAGLAGNANDGAHLVTMLAAPLAAHRRAAVGFAALAMAGLTIFLTLSRGAMLAYLVLVRTKRTLSMRVAPSSAARSQGLSLGRSASTRPKLSRMATWSSIQRCLTTLATGQRAGSATSAKR